MPRSVKPLPLSGLIDLSSDRMRFVAEDYVVEKDYEGNYADLSNEAELRLLETLREKPWQEVIAEEVAETSPWLYQVIIDKGRSLFLDLLEVPQGGNYLDVGSGWGQVSLPLAKHGNVVALDLTANRLNILQAIAQQEKVSLSYAQGNFLTFPFKQNGFDLIIFNGSLEWIGIGRKENERIRDIQLKALCRAGALLKPGGQIYIGIENSLGLKYLLGAPDDHTGLAFFTFLPEIVAESQYSSQDQSLHLPTKTWSLAEYRQLIAEAGLEEERVYGCFPDYKLIRQMIDIRDINDYLTLRGLPTPEHLGTDGSPFGHEKELDALYRLLASNSIAQYFCPSYGLILRKRR